MEIKLVAHNHRTHTTRCDTRTLQTDKGVDSCLVVFLRDPGGNTLAVVAAVGAAGAVSAAALHQEAARPENGVRPLELLAQRHGEVPRRAAVESNLLPQQIEISSSSRAQETRSDQRSAGSDALRI